MVLIVDAHLVDDKKWPLRLPCYGLKIRIIMNKSGRYRQLSGLAASELLLCQSGDTLHYPFAAELGMVEMRGVKMAITAN